MKRYISFLVFFAISVLAQGKDVKGVVISKLDGEALHISNADIKSMSFADGNAVITSVSDAQLLIPRSQIRTISPVSNISTQYSVSFDGEKATVVNPYALKGITTAIDGAYVTTTNNNETEELTFALSGSTSNGGYEYNGVYKFTLNLNSVKIKSNRGAAVNILCGKRIAVVVEGENNLQDCVGGEQKACLYFKGHPEIEGSGTLNLTGNTKHAMSSKEYIQLKKKFEKGTINVLSAVGDGIHAGQYFQINNGSVKIRNVKDDGIQAEATNDETDELNGQMIIKGGKIDVQCDADGVVVESSVSAPAYAQAVAAPGGPGGGMPPGGPGGGGWPGGWDQEDQETSCVACLKCDSLCTISGGTIILKATGKGGKCIKVDNDLLIGAAGSDRPVISATTTGGVVSGSGENLNGQPKAIKAYGNITIDNGQITTKTSQPGGEGIECKSYLTINGGTVVCDTYDDGINAAAKITVNGGLIWTHATNNDGMDCNGREGFEFNGGVILSSGTNAPEEGFDCDNNSFVINGGTLIGTGGATSNPTKAAQPYKTVSSQNLTANSYLSLQKQDGTVICSYKVPKTLNRATVLVSSPEFQSGTSYKLVVNSTAVTNPTESFLDGVFTLGGTLTGGTNTSFTPQKK